MKKKKPTGVDKIVADHAKQIEGWYSTPENGERAVKRFAQRLKALTKRLVAKAVKDAFHPSVDADREYRLIDRKRVAAKYGVKL